jgi:hypothetical protein
MTGTVTLSNSHIGCAVTASGPWIGIDTTFSLGGVAYGLGVGQFPAGPNINGVGQHPAGTNIYVIHSAATPTGWTTPDDASQAGILSLNPDTGTRFDSFVRSISGGATLHVTGSITCPPPGSPSNLSFSGDVVGDMIVTHVNCNESSQVEYGSQIEVIGTVNAQTYSLLMQLSKGAPYEVLMSRPADGVGWDTGAGPSPGLYNVDVGRGGHIDSTATRYESGRFVPGRTLRIVGAVTCPA